MDAALVVRNWFFGWYVVEYEQRGEDRAQYGAFVIKRLSEALTRQIGKGFSPRSLEQTRRIYLTFRSIPQTLSADLAEDEELVLPSTAEWNLVLPSVSRRFPLGWSQYVSLLTIDSPDERRFYEIEAAANQWSVRELERQIASSPYQRLALSWDKEEIRRLSAPTVRPIPAQGIALGHRGKASQAPKGRPKTACRDIAPAREFLFPSSLNLHPSHDPYRLQTDRGRRDPGGVGNAPMF